MWNNEIKYIESIPKFTVLQRIYLNSNKFTEFPDFLNVSLTLRSLEMSKNEITYIPEEKLISLISLIYLDMRKNPIHSLPNSCYIDNTLTVKWLSRSFDCDWRMAYVKMLQRMDKIVFDQKPPRCRRPSYLVGIHWDEISLFDLMNVTG